MTAPRVFISYSHDSVEHKLWVAKLAYDLRVNGVDAVLDQWDLNPGGDIGKFMEDGVKTSARVIVVCSANYVERAEAGKGGVGYEKMMVTAELINDLGTKKFIPVLRGSGATKVPSYLGYRMYIDFEDDAKYPSSFNVLLREILGTPDPAKPAIGKNPFESGAEPVLSGSVPPSPAAGHPSDPSLEDEPTDFVQTKAVTTLKQFLISPSHPMQLWETIMPVAKGAAKYLHASKVTDYGDYPNQENLLVRIKQSNEATNQLCQLLAVGCFWATPDQGKTFSKALAQVAIVPQPTGTFYELWENVARYPALRGFYAGGIAAVSNENFVVLKQLALDVKTEDKKGDPAAPLVVVLHQHARFAQSYWKWLPGMERHYFPVSDYLRDSLRPMFVEELSDQEYADAFERFEILQAMLYAALAKRERFWAPLGAFAWRNSHSLQRMQDEIKESGVGWAPLASGLFGGSLEQAQRLIEQLIDFTNLVRNQVGIW